MSTVTLDEIKNDGAGAFHRVEEGETLVVLDSDRPVAEIRPIESAPKKPRPSGLAAGQFVVTDAFFEPLPEDIQRAFEGE